MSKPRRGIVHVLLFLLAFVVFYLGLSVGLQVNPGLGTTLWVVSVVIVVLNVVWMRRSSR